MCFSPYDILPFFNPWKSRFDAVCTDSIILFSKPCSPRNSLFQEIAQSVQVRTEVIFKSSPALPTDTMQVLLFTST